VPVAHHEHAVLVKDMRVLAREIRVVDEMKDATAKRR
jgi:hypothetical protein